MSWAVLLSQNPVKFKKRLNERWLEYENRKEGKK